MLRQGDIVFRLGDARVAAAWFLSADSSLVRPAAPSRTPASSRSRMDRRSFMTARPRESSASRSRSGCSTAGTPGEAKWQHCAHIAGVIGYCRIAYERQVPFDNGFRMDDDSLYCLELTEKAFRSQGLALSEPVRIGDWEYLASFPLTAFLIPPVSGLVLDRPITLESSRFTSPATSSRGFGAFPLLETVVGPAPRCSRMQSLASPTG